MPTESGALAPEGTVSGDTTGNAIQPPPQENPDPLSEIKSRGAAVATVAPTGMAGQKRPQVDFNMEKPVSMQSIPPGPPASSEVEPTRDTKRPRTDDVQQHVSLERAGTPAVALDLTSIKRPTAATKGRGKKKRPKGRMQVKLLQ